MRISLFKTDKPRQFKYHSRYYNPDKADRERRHKRYNAKKGEREFDKDEFREELKYRWSMQRESQLPFNKRVSSIKRIILVLVILIIVLALMYLLARVIYYYSI